MRFWRNSGGCCCGGGECGVVVGFVYACCGTNALAGATVTLQQSFGGAPPVDVSTTTTAADGSYSLPFHATGNGQVVVSHPTFVTKTVPIGPGPALQELACGEGPYIRDVTLDADGVNWTCICADCGDGGPCAGTGIVLLPTTLFLSDGAETITMHAGGPGWVGCTIKNVVGSAEEGVNCGGDEVMVNTPVTYELNCTVNGVFSLTVTAPCCPSTASTPKYLVARGDCENRSGFECSMGAAGEPTSCSPLAVTLGGGIFGNMGALYAPNHVFTLSE